MCELLGIKTASLKHRNRGCTKKRSENSYGINSITTGATIAGTIGVLLNTESLVSTVSLQFLLGALCVTAVPLRSFVSVERKKSISSTWRAIVNKHLEPPTVTMKKIVVVRSFAL